MRLEVTVTKIRFFAILGLVLLIGGLVFVYGQVGGSVPNPGHDISQLSGVQGAITINCPDGQFVKSISSDGTVTCGVGDSGGDQSSGCTSIFGPASNQLTYQIPVPQECLGEFCRIMLTIGNQFRGFADYMQGLPGTPGNAGYMVDGTTFTGVGTNGDTGPIIIIGESGNPGRGLFDDYTGNGGDVQIEEWVIVNLNTPSQPVQLYLCT